MQILFALIRWIAYGGVAGGLFAYKSAYAYTLLAPIAGVDSVSSLSSYIGIVFGIVIGVGSVLAVIMIVFAGLQYIASGASESLRGAAKERIRNAFLGLFLALGTWVILYTINPTLTGLGDAGASLGSGPGTGALPGGIGDGGYASDDIRQWYYFYKTNPGDAWQLAGPFAADAYQSCVGDASLKSSNGKIVMDCQAYTQTPTAPGGSGSGGGSSQGLQTHYCFTYTPIGSTAVQESCTALTFSQCQANEAQFAASSFTINNGSCYTRLM